AIEQPATFPGGPAAFKSFIDREIKNLPCIGATDGKKSYIKFIVERDGRITQPEIVKGCSCDEIALLIVSHMPRWEAGRQSGRAVRSQFILKIDFSINTP
ncbi:MAG TPA: energy transducer TonB, partial [Cyclobacteriaceae bacterium]|nr:energy transducer TonB [Cyclobacteriaceae bacterium]